MLQFFAEISRKLLFFQTDFLRKFWDCSGAKGCKSCRAWKMLSNAYFLAKFRFDTAENKPAKNLQNFRKLHFRKMHFRNAFSARSRPRAFLATFSPGGSAGHRGTAGTSTHLLNTYQPRVIRIAKIVRLEKEVDISFLTGFFLPPFSIIPVDQPF